MPEDKWADLMSNLMKIAEDLFSSVKNFKKGKLVAEVEAEVNVRIEIARDKEGRVNASLGILPKEGEEERGEEAPTVVTETEEKVEEIKPDIEEIKDEIKEIDVLDVEENKEEEIQF